MFYTRNNWVKQLGKNWQKMFLYTHSKFSKTKDNTL